MKKIIILLLLITIAISNTLQAQEMRNVISTNVLGLFGAAVQTSVYRNDLSYERAIDNQLAFSVGAEYGRYSYGTATGGGTSLVTSVTGFGFTQEVRYYPTIEEKVAPRGFFLGIFAKEYILKEKYRENSISFENDGSAFGIGFDIGYKLGRKNFVAEPLLGYAFGGQNGIGEDPRMDSFFRDFPVWTLFLRAEFRMGVCF